MSYAAPSWTATFPSVKLMPIGRRASAAGAREVPMALSLNAQLCFVVGLAVAGVSAGCGNDESLDYGTGGIGNRGGATQVTGTSAPTSTSGGARSQGSASGTASQSLGTTPSTSTEQGATSPPSTVETPDTYHTSCELEQCGDGEGCYETCPSGSCCVHACEGQIGLTSGIVACCDRQGGTIPGASCGS